jgi:Pentapeptide repeats (8 copies)
MIVNRALFTEGPIEGEHIMIVTVVTAGIVSLFSALVGALIALKIQYDRLRRMQAHNEGWERAQESHQRDWEVKQEKYATEVETRLTQKVQQVQKVWTEWEAKDQKRIQALNRELKEAKTYLHVKHELARLPRIEERPLMAQTTRQHQQSFSNWQPPLLQGADVSNQDLSHRYLAQADLRHAKLTNTNFFMADLSDAFLTGADLSGANLSGANLSGVDLRGGILTGANFLVTDLQNTILLGADLRGARSLTVHQVQTAIYDNTTQFDPEFDITHPGVNKLDSDAPLPETPAEPESSELQITGKMAAVLSAASPASQMSEEAIVMSSPPETPHLPSFSDIELLIPQQKVLFSSPLPLNDSLLGQEEEDLPEDISENIHSEEFDTVVPNVEYNGSQRAKSD